jgi:hypothetical protein
MPDNFTELSSLNEKANNLGKKLYPEPLTVLWRIIHFVNYLIGGKIN